MAKSRYKLKQRMAGARKANSDLDTVTRALLSIAEASSLTGIALSLPTLDFGGATALQPVVITLLGLALAFAMVTKRFSVVAVVCVVAFCLFVPYIPETKSSSVGPDERKRAS